VKPLQAIIVVVVALFCGCGGSLKQEKVPYFFRQSLLDTEEDALLREGDTTTAPAQPIQRSAPGGRPGQQAADRCWGLRGRTFAGPYEEANLKLLAACFNRAVARDTLAGEGLNLRSVGGPRPGDLLLFHNTRDRNRNGALDDRHTATGVVVKTAKGRTTFIFLRGRRARAGVLNLRRPHHRRLNGTRIQNTYLRSIHPSDPPGTRYLAGELLAGYGPL